MKYILQGLLVIMAGILIIILTVAIVFSIIGYKPKNSHGLDEVCFKGVVYYKSLYKLAPAFKQDGTLYLCEPNGKENN